MKSSTLPIDSPVDTSAEHVKELENELLKLRIENAFLKAQYFAWKRGLASIELLPVK